MKLSGAGEGFARESGIERLIVLAQIEESGQGDGISNWKKAGIVLPEQTDDTVNSRRKNGGAVDDGFTDAYYTFIGDGDHQAALVERAHRLELDDHVEFTGRITEPQELRRYLSSADLGIAPDGWSAGARWKHIEDIPNDILSPAIEAILEGESRFS